MNFECTDEIKVITNCEGYFNKDLTAKYLYKLISDLKKLIKLLKDKDSENKIYYIDHHELININRDTKTFLEKVFLILESYLIITDICCIQN